MKILHLSDGALPDWRIEKSAMSASNFGHEVFFAGMPKSDNYNRKIFSRFCEVNWTPKAKLGLPVHWQSVKKQVERALREVRPDIVHAHDVFAANMMLSEFDTSFVYDNHEFWSRYSWILPEMIQMADSDHRSNGNIMQMLLVDLPLRAKRTFKSRYAAKLWSRWERKVVSSKIPTITVSDKIAEGLVDMGGDANRIFVVPNFPLTKEVKDFQKPLYYPTLSSVYAGGDGLHKEKRPNRNIDGLTHIFMDRDVGRLTILGWEEEASANVTYKGFLSRREMFAEMFNHSIGLLPWKKHWTHYYSNPNKVYEYAHAGLFVMCTSSFETISATLKKNCVTFDDYDDLASQLQYFKENLDELYKRRLKIFEFARNELTWEKYEKNIFRPYQLC
jgi:glycosyltransferase involved in cell wall biosynthesis